MVFCKNCNYEARAAFEVCPVCKNKFELSEKETTELLVKYSEALKNKEYEAAVELCRMLAFSGHTVSEREYARMLERGELVERDYDEAMRFYRRAAGKRDAYSSYRYSRLISRANSRAGNFWLLYSAYLACPDAYPSAAELLSKEGFIKEANHFYVLSAKHDDIDSIVEVASRYFNGKGFIQSSEHAKWYMDKLNFPPLYALKLAYKLKGVQGKEPAEEFFDKEPLLRRLLAEAGKCGFSDAYFYLTGALAELGDVDSMTVLGTLLADGVGCEKNIGEAVRVLTEAASHGSGEAYLCLAEIFLAEESASFDAELGARYLELAAKHGESEAYKTLGEMYESGKLVERDFKKAEQLYRKAADRGINGALEAADRIVKTRNSFFEDGLNKLSSEPEKSFRAFAIAAGMGHSGAPLKLADAYLKGCGVEADRASAFYWYREAAEAGDRRAFYPLGLCYLNGVGVNRDIALAKDSLKKAVSFGSEGAKIALDKLSKAEKKARACALYSKAMRLIHLKKFSAAKECLILSDGLDYAKASYILGCVYEFGLGTASDRSAAAKCYNKAYLLGFSDDKSKYKKAVLRLIR